MKTSACSWAKGQIMVCCIEVSPVRVDAIDSKFTGKEGLVGIVT
jgi:hypothetical protein